MYKPLEFEGFSRFIWQDWLLQKFLKKRKKLKKKKNLQGMGWFIKVVRKIIPIFVGQQGEMP